MPLPLALGYAALQGASSFMGGRNAKKANKRRRAAIKQTISGLEEAHKFNTSSVLSQIDQMKQNKGLDTRARLIQARREAGRAKALNAEANAQGGSATNTVTEAFSRAGGDIEVIGLNSERQVNTSLRSIIASRLSLNNQINSLNAGAPVDANPFMEMLNIGASALNGYVKGGGEFGGSTRTPKSTMKWNPTPDGGGYYAKT